MKSHYIYELIVPSNTEGKKPTFYTVLFCPDKKVDKLWVKNELKEFFQSHVLPDDIIVIAGSYLKKEIEQIFINEVSEVFSNINKIHKPHFETSINVLLFDENGKLNCIKERIKRSEEFYHDLIQEGLRKIFVDRGGLIESHEAHHFVFPSGKHSSKFLRTGNVLLYSPEIYFIALCVLSKYDPQKHDFILCDTSSINSLAFAVAELKSRFNKDYIIPPINSFKSYSIFEEDELAFGARSLFLVSSSTSGGIIERIKEKMDSVKKENIVLVFFLGEEEQYSKHKSNIICDLSVKSSLSNIGLDVFKTHKSQDCQLCTKGSLPVNVVGDIFLREKPRINKVLLKKDHSPKMLSNFIHEFLSVKEDGLHILKCHYKENDYPEQQYDIYFDIDQVVDRLLKNEDRFKNFRKKLYKRINLSIPSNTKYIISLPDSGSEKLAKLIFNEFEKTHKNPPDIIKQNEINEKLSKDIEGTVVVVSSSMVNGGNLLYLSRALRDYENLSIIYFIGLVRTAESEYYDFIRKNLCQGALLGANNSPFIHVECMYLPDEYRKTTWLNEKIFLEKLIDYLEDNTEFARTLEFFKNRLEHFNSVDNNNKGLSDELFYPNVLDFMKPLILNKNFAFLDFESYGKNSQADIYFIISVILNDLRHKNVKGDSLKQLEYERNVIDPGNFLRFNDGLIQACILRAAKPKELSYDLDDSCSAQIKDIIDDMISHPKRAVCEALMEFVYALAINKLKLKSEHRKYIFERLYSLNNIYINALCSYAQSELGHPATTIIS